jgi:tRNA (guanine9-N1)-methyltransferase
MEMEEPVVEEQIESLPPNELVMSKSMKKKEELRMKKKEIFKQKKLEKKARRKQIKRQLASSSSKLATTVNNASSEDEIKSCPDPDVLAQRNARKRRRLEEFLALCNQNFEIIIDCSWEHEHNESSLNSLTQQIMYCYGFNRRHSHPVNFKLFSIGNRIRENLKKLKFENWIAFEAHEEEFLNNPQYQITPLTTNEDHHHEYQQHQQQQPKQLIYLTSDAEETIETLDSNHVYIIGGIVDRNRLKGATYMKAQTHNIKTAKLPIKDLFSLGATHVLTVNHVFEILLRFAETQNWAEALEATLPKRKDPKPKSKRPLSEISQTIPQQSERKQDDDDNEEDEREIEQVEEQVISDHENDHEHDHPEKKPCLGQPFFSEQAITLTANQAEVEDDDMNGIEEKRIRC